MPAVDHVVEVALFLEAIADVAASYHQKAVEIVCIQIRPIKHIQRETYLQCCGHHSMDAPCPLCMMLLRLHCFPEAAADASDRQKLVAPYSERGGKLLTRKEKRTNILNDYSQPLNFRAASF
jgi:hypothetical protein